MLHSFVCTLVCCLYSFVPLHFIHFVHFFVSLPLAVYTRHFTLHFIFALFSFLPPLYPCTHVVTHTSADRQTDGFPTNPRFFGRTEPANRAASSDQTRPDERTPNRQSPGTPDQTDGRYWTGRRTDGGRLTMPDYARAFVLLAHGLRTHIVASRSSSNAQRNQTRQS